MIVWAAIGLLGRAMIIQEEDCQQNNFMLGGAMMSNSHSEGGVGKNNRLEEWALISKAKAIEYERMKQMERMEEYNKKMKFKQDLDLQLSQKTNTRQLEYQRDQQYFNHILQKNAQQSQKEERDKMQRLLKRRQMEEENKHIQEESIRNSRSQSQANGYKLDIGVKSELIQRQREEEGKKNMLDTLELQLRIKRQQSERNKIQEFYQDIRHNQKQAHTFQRSGPSKVYGQDQRVYEHYQMLVDEKKRQESQLDKKFTEDAALQKQRAEQLRQQYERKRKQQMALDMKETLEQQVKIHNSRKNSQKQVNPEDYSFEFISNIYREHPPSYNKLQYEQELRKQAEEQQRRKKNLDYMSEEEYKLNANQLNKIVTGNYAHQEYVDRSLGAIGERRKDNRKLLEREDQNSQFIMQRLEELRRRKGGVYSRMDNSALL